MLTFHVRRLDSFSDQYLKRKLFPMTLPSEFSSVMKTRLIKCLDRKNTNDQVDDLAFLLRNNGVLVGWGLAFGFAHKKPNLMVFILPEFRKKGYGKILIQKAMRSLKRKSFKHVYAAPWNDRARKFYVKLGFKLIAYKQEDSNNRDYMFIAKKDL